MKCHLSRKIHVTPEKNYTSCHQETGISKMEIKIVIITVTHTFGATLVPRAFSYEIKGKPWERDGFGVNRNFLSHLIFLKQNITWPKVSPCCSAKINLSVALGYGLLMCSLNHACNALQVSLGIPLFLRIPEGQMLRGGINLQRINRSKTFKGPLNFPLNII